ncbi:MAG TPA: tagatose-bisphosphate aldolase [Ruminococcaceae bacterium]|nr:tagatose-bisphosphate aldolase [Oscillospiraceae bacterium]HBQ46296.1 tagatose-bisphosphate aldolase [Oscillospiraceae bacterium]HBT90256.1 tagatose-bisphosphate aldolase [Oscillospiraceae bacterium]HCB90417.1 tagatose-bisphosphate aldolase [Oscillospiraceae bacterium]
MPLTTSKQMLLDARKGGYAVGAFNAENMEMVQAIVAAAEEMRAPVMIQTTPGTIRYAGVDLYYANVSAAAKKATVPVALHLDHGNSFALAVQALRAGYTSIMIDGSKQVLDKNIAITKSVVDVCAPCGIPVEGELGRVGGKEDDTEFSGTGYTDPDEAVRFVAETGVSSLAVGVGTAHGVYKTKPVLNVGLVSTLRGVLSIPMVLHGASGLTDEAIRDCVSRGICKVNFATELRIAFSNAVKEYLKQDPDVFDPKKYCAKGREAVKQQVIRRIKVCGCDGKA